MHDYRRCFRCGLEKPITEYYRSNVRYYQRECKDCTKTRRDGWWRTESGKRSSANTKLKARFGLTIDEYEARLKEHGGKCEICGAGSSMNGHRLGIDHNHETGKLRGFLCKACNRGLGSFGDSPTRLASASKYLRKYGYSKGVK